MNQAAAAAQFSVFYGLFKPMAPEGSTETYGFEIKPNPKATWGLADEVSSQIFSISGRLDPKMPVFSEDCLPPNCWMSTNVRCREERKNAISERIGHFLVPIMLFILLRPSYHISLEISTIGGGIGRILRTGSREKRRRILHCS